MATIPTKEFKSKPHAIMWGDDFSERYPEKKLTIIRNVKKQSTYAVGELDHINDQYIVFKDAKRYGRDEWIKSFF